MFAHSEDSGQLNGRNSWALAQPRPAVRKKTQGTAERHRGFGASRATCGGFSLLELLVSITVLSVILGGVLSAISASQQTSARTELQSDMYENVRSVAELMEQEVGQAGLVSLPSNPQPTLSAATAVGAASATVTSTTSMYNGEQLLIDAGNNKEELVALNANPTATTIAFTPPFAYTHSNGAPVTVLGAFPSGVVPPGTTDGSTSVDGAAKSVLNLFGDINGDGSLVYVRYTCDTTVTPGTLTRSITTITPGNNTISAAQTLLSTLIPNPASVGHATGAPCFQFTSYNVGSLATPVVTNVGLTISVQSLKPDPRTGQYLTMTKSFLDMAPRNVLSAFELANALISNRLQATPTNVTLY